MLKCFPKGVSQRKSIFQRFSPHYVKIIQNSISFFIATWPRTVAKLLTRTFAVIKRGRVEGQQIGFSLRESLSRNKPFPFLQHDLNKRELRARTVTH